MLQVLLSSAIIGPIAYAFGNTLTAATILATCLSLSPNAIVMHILMERRKLASRLAAPPFPSCCCRIWPSCRS